MARYLVHHNPTSAWTRPHTERRLRFDLSQMPTVSTGIGGDNTSHWWIEEDDVPETAVDTTKPPYRIPLMTEIERLPWNGLTVASTFSGCGGSCLGFRMAGYRTAVAAEFIPAAVDTYRANHPGVPVETRDIREVNGKDFLALAGVDSVDVLEGSPPCASFSTAGRRSAHWGDVKKYSDTTQRTDDLFFEYARLVGDIQPRAFVAENVAGLVRGVAKGYFKLIHAALREKGYRVEARLLDAQWLGVPQARSRVIFVGVRDDLGLDPGDAFPTPLPYRYSIRDALPWIDQVSARGGAHGYTEKVFDDDEPIHSVWASGADRDQFEIEVGANGAFGEENWKGIDNPAATLGSRSTTGNGRSSGGMLRVRREETVVEKRKFTIAELRRLCGFPDDFALTGTYGQQWERLGRAVPPPMMRAVAEGVAALLT